MNYFRVCLALILVLLFLGFVSANDSDFKKYRELEPVIDEESGPVVEVELEKGVKPGVDEKVIEVKSGINKERVGVEIVESNVGDPVVEVEPLVVITGSPTSIMPVSVVGVQPNSSPVPVAPIVPLGGSSNNNGGSSSEENVGSSSSRGGDKGCVTTWVCDVWSVCSEEQQTRSCVKEKPACYAKLSDKPVEVQSCEENQDLETAPPEGLLTRITGAVVGTVGKPGTLGMGIFFVILGVVFMVVYRMRYFAKVD
jgi:hypothetical protein